MALLPNIENNWWLFVTNMEKSPEGPLNAFQSHRCLCCNYSARRDSQELITGVLLSWFLFKGTKVLVLWQFNMVSFRECPQNKAHFSHWLDMALTKVASVPKIYVETSLTKWITNGKKNLPCLPGKFSLILDTPLQIFCWHQSPSKIRILISLIFLAAHTLFFMNLEWLL